MCYVVDARLLFPAARSVGFKSPAQSKYIVRDSPFLTIVKYIIQLYLGESVKMDTFLCIVKLYK